MLQTRLWMGALLILLGAGTLAFDFKPAYPLLLALALIASGVACYELISLLPEPKPKRWLTQLGVAGLILANWPAHLWHVGSAWHWIIGGLAVSLLAAFLLEGFKFVQPGSAVARISLAFWVFGYVGLLASFLLQLRWLPDGRGPIAMALAIFVPKCCDIGAYFTGRFLGRSKMTPTLSPKKTWEGAIGGLVFAVIASVGLNSYGTTHLHVHLLSWGDAVGFGLAVGVAAQLGDLMESLIKRDCERKDASAAIPGFGGVLDVLDSILFSAPLSYLWLANS